MCYGLYGLGLMSSREVVVRKAYPSDASSIFRIHLESLEGLDEEDYEWFTGILRVRSRRRKVLVAEQDGRIIGFIIAYKYRDRAYIDSLAVDQEYRGKGIGGKLLEEMEKILVSEGVEKITLSVKKDNYSALGFYLKKGYVIEGLVLLLTAPVKRIHMSDLDGYRVVVKKADLSDKWSNKFLASTSWSTLTEPVDKMIYARHYNEEYILKIYRNDKLRGIAEYTPDKHVVVDYLAVSYNKPTEALTALLSALKIETEKNNVEKITIPIDSSKTTLIRKILEHGYRVENAEYKLVKTIV